MPEDRLYIDRDKANDLGVPVRQVAEALRTILAGSEAGEFREDGDEYTILVKVKDADLLTLDQILDLSMRNDRGSSSCCGTSSITTGSWVRSTSSGKIRSAC